MLLHAVLGILGLCGCEPRKGRSFGRGAVTEVEFSVDGAPSALCVPRTPKAASLRPALLERLRGRTVLLPWRLVELEPGAAAAGVQLVPAWRFLRALHEARIRTIELELAKPRRKPAAGDRRPGRRGRG